MCAFAVHLRVHGHSCYTGCGQHLLGEASPLSSDMWNSLSVECMAWKALRAATV